MRTTDTFGLQLDAGASAGSVEQFGPASPGPPGTYCTSPNGLGFQAETFGTSSSERPSVL